MRIGKLSSRLSKLDKILPLVLKYPEPKNEAIGWSDDKAVMYDDVAHKYTMGSKVLTSATGLIKLYKPEFAGTTGKTERELGLSQEDVLKLWERKGQIAVNRGNWIHYVLEQVLAHRMSPTVAKLKYGLDDELMLYVTAIHDWIGGESLKLEKILYVNEGVAGRADCLMEKDGVAHVIDWKTNKSDLKKAYGFLKPPFGKIANSKLEGYKIQIGLYGVMYEARYGVPAARGTIVHLDGKVHLIRVDMVKYKRIAKQMIAHYGKSQP
jgi:hypothetical protein